MEAIMKNLLKIGSAKIGFVLCFGVMMTACSTVPASSNTDVVTSKAALVEQTKDVKEWKAATVKVSDGSEKICKRTQQTGTRFTKKVCMTQAEWDNMAEASKRVTSSAQQRSAIQGPRQGN
jgi:hypothetical protein